MVINPKMEPASSTIRAIELYCLSEWVSIVVGCVIGYTVESEIERTQKQTKNVEYVTNGHNGNYTTKTKKYF